MTPERGSEPQPPLPPDDLDGRALPIDERPAGSIWWRIHQRKYHPLFFGPPCGAPPGNRFDSADGSFRVCYLGASEEASFAESFYRGPGLILEDEDLKSRAFSQIENIRPLRLVQIHGAGLIGLGATAAVASGPYSASQLWALALHQHGDRPDGIIYRARHDDDVFCAAIYDRASSALIVRHTEAILDDKPRLKRLLDRYEAFR